MRSLQQLEQAVSLKLLTEIDTENQSEQGMDFVDAYGRVGEGLKALKFVRTPQVV